MYAALIGENIREVRVEKGLSQEALAERCGFSNTTLSSYENGRREPSLSTIAKIAHGLGVSIDRLYYGDESEAFITSETNEGRKIVNAVYYLWETDVISYYENFNSRSNTCFYDGEDDNPGGVYFFLNKHWAPLKRLITSLDEFKEKKETYPDPDKYLEILLSSVANEINREIENEKKQRDTKKGR
ncbi:MAG: helix-turn-helix transcriptional regulator [Lachnospiraceae bacterium]|nr:helix-turn-helix transcriptional regulator [Lachnospiraceae bacterium]